MKVISKRDNGGMCPEIVRELSKSQGFTRLVEYELGYGGRVTHLRENALTVQTNLLGCRDETIFEGTIEEMLPLVTIAKLHQATRVEHLSAKSVLVRYLGLQESNLSLTELCAIAELFITEGPEALELVY